MAQALSNMRFVAYSVSNRVLGSTFRDRFMMPLYGKKSFSPSSIEDCRNIINRDIPDPLRPNKQQVLDHFEIRDMELQVSVGSSTYQIKVRLFESKNVSGALHTCLRFGGNDETLDIANVKVFPYLESHVKACEEKKDISQLRFIQFPAYGHNIKNEGASEWMDWKPSEAKEIGEVFFKFLESLKDSGLLPDSLICTSLGSVVFEAMDDVDPALLPKTLILDRPLSSLWKVGTKLYNPFTAYIHYEGAYISGWAPDPEAQLVKFFNTLAEKSTPTEMSQRKVVLLEVANDFYFSGKGAFDSNFTSRLQTKGVQTFRKTFEPNEVSFHERTAHGLSIDYLSNGPEEKESTALPLKPYERVVDAIVKHLFV